uniref:Uncharacterized protein n=1 Tax=Tetranychus urticae TaxID=32264 RepID=T1L4R7_TETUR
MKTASCIFNPNDLFNEIFEFASTQLYLEKLRCYSTCLPWYRCLNIFMNPSDINDLRWLTWTSVGILRKLKYSDGRCQSYDFEIPSKTSPLGGLKHGIEVNNCIVECLNSYQLLQP